LGVKTLDRQGAKMQEYLDNPSFRTGGHTESIGFRNVTLFHK
jgi:hypothetical protein